MNEELRVIIKAELGSFMTDIKKAINEVKNFGKASKKSSEELDGFVKEVSDQARALARLKQEYINAAAAQGRTSKAAKDCENRIKDLSKSYAANSKVMKELADYADSLDASLKGIGKNGKINISSGEDTDEGLDAVDMKQLNKETNEFKNILQSIVALDAANVISSIFGPELINKLKLAKEYFNEAKIFGGVGLESLNPRSKLYKEEIDWDGWADAFKGSMETLKMSFESLGKSIKTALAGIGKALSGIAGVLLVIIADLAIFIGLWRNASKVSEEIKKLNTEANKINMSTQSYSEWSYILQQCGVDAERLTDFIKKLTEKQKETLNGSNEVIGAFKELGLSQEEVVSMGQEELFAETVKRLQQVDNATQRTSLAYRIFTDDAVHLNTVLHLSNSETSTLIGNYYSLGGAPTKRLIERSLTLEASIVNLKQAWAGISNTLAEVFLPVITWVIQKLTIAISAVSIFLKALLGVEMSTKSVSDAASGAVSGIKDYNNEVKKTTNSVKELQRVTFGFDELNIMPKTTTSGSDSGYDTSSIYGNGGFSTDIPVIELPDMSKFQDWCNKYRDVISVITALSLIAIGVILAVIGFGHGNVPLGLLGISLAGLGIAIGSVDGGAFDTIREHFGSFSGWLKENWTTLLVGLIFGPFGMAFAMIYKNNDEFKGKVDKFVADIVNFFKDNWVGILLSLLVSPFIGGFILLYDNCETFRTKLNEFVAWVVDCCVNFKERVKRGWEKVKNWFNSEVKPIFTKEYWKEKFDNMKHGFTTACSELVAKIKEKWASIKSWFKNDAKKIFTKEYWKGVFDSIKDGAKESFNGIISIVESGINKIVRKINTLSWKVPDWVPNIGGKTWGFNFNEVYIPRLAKGGIATRSVLANIGENGKEAVLPLENNTQWIDMLADKLAARSNTPSKIVLAVDGRELGWASIRNINGITQQLGELPLVFA